MGGSYKMHQIPRVILSLFRVCCAQFSSYQYILSLCEFFYSAVEPIDPLVCWKI